MRKILFTLFLAGAALLGGTPVRAVSLAVVPDNDVIPVGGAFSAELVISGLEEFSAPSLSAYDLEVTFNPLVIDLMGISFGDPILGDQLDLFGLGSITDVISSVGQVQIMQLSLDLPGDLDSLQAGTFTLATLDLMGLAPGNSALTLLANTLGDSIGDPLTATLQNTEVTVAPVPEPLSLWLMLIGLIMGSPFTRCGCWQELLTRLASRS